MCLSPGFYHADVHASFYYAGNLMYPWAQVVILLEFRTPELVIIIHNKTYVIVWN